MSKYVDEIIKDLKENNTSWSKHTKCPMHGVMKDNIEIIQVGNTKLLSISEIRIDGQEIKTTYFDRWRIEKAVLNWYKNIPLSTLTK